jgi:16S rRNA (cytosine967-C5)-methyltransferase
MQLSGTVLRGIEQILKDAEHKPADAALRQALRSSGLNPDQKTLISRSVFTYYRWFGWLDRTKPLRGQLEHAFDLASNVERLPDAELLARALPEWVRNEMELSPSFLRELQREPRLWLRARPGTAAEVARRLGDCEIHPSIPDAIWYHGENDLFRTPEFHNGAFEIQDLSSQIVGRLCAPAPGQTWWDACAGEGGKTLLLCDLMQNKGLVWASDTAEWRLDILKRRASRAKLFNYRLKAWTNTDQLPTKTKFDGILVDAPCSGIGTWGRNPHARWTTPPSALAELAKVQRQILNAVANSLKPRGKLIYSVCTLTRAETRELAAQFRQEHPAFSPLPLSVPGLASDNLGELEIVPEVLHSVGMFIANWQNA